jgi:serine/threonine protein kinase/tetratricopeptide (TPR) repeat protein
LGINVKGDFDGYRITRAEIARGGSGVVHDATAPDGRRVAIKVLDRGALETRLSEFYKKMATETGLDESSIADEVKRSFHVNVSRFKDEYKVLTTLSHPNIAAVEKIGFFEGNLYIVSEYIDGRPIAEYTRGMAPEEMVPLFVQALMGLDYIHKSGFVHLDIKSDNILVDEEGGRPIVKIIDFGLAMSPKAYSGGFMGSISYMAPEVALARKEEVDARADLFSFGVVMYRSITWGQLPYSRTSGAKRDEIRKAIEREAQVLPDPPSAAHSHKPGFVPEYLDKVVMHLLAHSPRERYYGNARAVINALCSHSPDAFADAEDAPGAYLMPEGDRHIGRENEQARLTGYVEALTDESGRQPPVVAIEGGPGMGKTHLLKKISDAASKKADVISIHSIRLPADGPSAENFIAKVSSSLSSNDRPCVIIIDDMHECVGGKGKADGAGDDAGAKVVGAIARAAALVGDRKKRPELYRDMPPMFICASFDGARMDMRSALAALSIEVDAVEHIRLAPLSYLEVDTYLKSTPVFKASGMPRERVDEIFRQTGGIPLEIRELLQEVDSRGVLFNLEGELVFSIPKKATHAIAATTEARLLATYNSCDPDERRIMEIIAVWCRGGLAESVHYNDLFHFLPIASLRQKLNMLVGKGIIFYDVDDETCSFCDSDFFQSLVYNTMAPDEAEQWHARIARFVEKRGGSRELSLFHRAHSPLSTESLRAAVVLAGARMKRDGDLVAAEELYSHAMERVPANMVKLASCLAALLASAYMQEGKYARAEALVGDAMHEIEERDLGAFRLHLFTQLINAQLRTKKFDEARRFIGRAARLCRAIYKGHANHQRLSLMNLAARWLYENAVADPARRSHMLQCAAALYRRSASIEARDGARGELVRNNDLGLVLIAMGDYDGAIDVLKERLAQYEREGFHFGILQTAIVLASAFRLSGRYDGAIRLARRAVELAAKVYQGRWLMFAYQTLAYAYHDKDEFEAALAEDDRWFATSALVEERREHARTALQIWNHKGHCYKELKRFDRAMLCFNAVLDGGPDAFASMYAHEGMGESFYLMGRFDEADGHLAKADLDLERMPRKAADAYAFPVHMLRARVWLAKGKKDEARAMLARIEPLSHANQKWREEFLDVSKLS